ncbi:XRE family transcriptional regulator [Agathobaculum butyriciproducens]|nr:XRE family transcriptional regulator [Agathobaculum butyriciproducens]RGC61175.1 XRE family transcriptional regulator [Agathobaculum butyriciproducens]
MSLQKILSFGLNTQVEIDYFLKFNDHTLVYEWNEVHSDEPSLIVNGDYSKEVSHGLQEIRVAAGLTQQELADLSGVNIRQIQKFEKGESQLQNATVETALKLADALGVDVHHLIEIN